MMALVRETLACLPCGRGLGSPTFIVTTSKLQVRRNQSVWVQANCKPDVKECKMSREDVLPECVLPDGCTRVQTKHTHKLKKG
jgi:hypothetical protein